MSFAVLTVGGRVVVCPLGVVGAAGTEVTALIGAAALVPAVLAVAALF